MSSWPVFPISMVAGVPLMIGGGAGAELRVPLGYAMVGGLVVSQLLTLFTTPVIYLYLDGLQSRRSVTGNSTELPAARRLLKTAV